MVNRQAASVRETAWRKGGEHGRELVTPNHRIRTTVRNPVLLARLPDFAEDALLHYRTAFVLLPGPREPLTSYVMGTRSEWAALTRERIEPARAERYLQIERGGFADRGIGYFFDIGTQDTFAVAAHEGWHQYAQTTFTDQMPPWLDEGCATVCEGFRWSTTDPGRAVFLPWANIERYDRLRDAHAAGALLPLRTLLDARPQVLLGDSSATTLDYYAQLWALILFLREGESGRYADGLALLLSDTANGRTRARLRQFAAASGQTLGPGPSVGSGLFAAYIDPDLERIEREYRAFIAEVVRPGGKQAIVTGRSPLAAQPSP